FMDDVTILLHTAACTAQLIKRLEELLSWSGMRINMAKSCKGRRVDTISFRAAGEGIPVLSEQPIRSLGREYPAELTNKHLATTVTAQLKDDLEGTDQSYLP
ncbi:hypothetical protein M9458_008651, partial [Cirrhinus mrigala]